MTKTMKLLPMLGALGMLAFGLVAAVAFSAPAVADGSAAALAPHAPLTPGVTSAKPEATGVIVTDGEDDDDACGDEEKVCICHLPPGNPENRHTICIGPSAVPAHIRNHGDSPEPCEKETLCGDGVDNDGDLKVDCADPDCAAVVTCLPEICNDGLDNNLDGKVDCQERSCAGQIGVGGETCEQPENLCADGKDNDADGTIDCNDDDCLTTTACDGAGPEVCADGMDNDLDRLIDCQDPECAGLAGPAGERCETHEASCADGFDNDGDTRTDCADPDCFAARVCDGAAAEICGDGLDNDGDHLIDCRDPECDGLRGPKGATCAQSEVRCADGFDDDGDGYKDCDDPDCYAATACDGSEPEVCADLHDNDHDRLVDCEDPECAGLPGPLGAICELKEHSCGDGFDNDADGYTDCDDADCFASAACDGAAAEDCVDGLDNDGDRLADCQDPECAGVMGAGGVHCETPEWSCDDGADNDGDQRIDCDDTDCRDHPACDGALPEACGDGVDNDGDHLTDCQDPECDGLTDGCGHLCQHPEAACNDDFDNDGDGRVDCDDTDCLGTPACDGSAAEICTDGVDNDNDHLVDCLDPECIGFPGPHNETCEASESTCDDGFDNDADGASDCTDPDCLGTLACGGSGVIALCRAVPPRLDRVEPPMAHQGDVVSVTLHGQRLKPGITLDLGPGLAVLSSESTSASEIRAQLQVLPAALLGERYVRAECTDMFGAARAHRFEIAFDCRRADNSGDGRIDGLDLAMLASRFGSATAVGDALDLNGDAHVDGDDLALMAAFFGRLAATCR